MAANVYVGWGITTFLSWLINRSNKDNDRSSSEPDSLNSSPAQIGTPVPVIMGRTILKSPLIIYYGDFSSKPYTETYSAHAKFSAWPLVLSLIAAYMAKPATGHQATPATVKPGASVSTSGGSGKVTGTTTSDGATYKDDLTGPLLNALFMWLLSWLINGRNLKTTVQKGFKYYLGYQMLACISGVDCRIRSVYLKDQQVWKGMISNAPLRIVAIGDLITNGDGYTSWTEILQEKYQGVTVINKGIGGNTTKEMLERFDSDVVAQNPVYCIIMGGINDAYHEEKTVPIEQSKANIQEMVQICRQNGIKPYIGLVTPTERYINGTEEQNNQVNAFRNWLRKYCAEASVSLIDFYGVFFDGSNLKESLLTGDLLHPNDEGHAAMGEAAVQVIGDMSGGVLPFTISIDNDELFGGPDEEGGFIGDIRVYLGGADQPADPWMVEQMSVDSVQEELRGLTPAYRPFVSLVVPTAYVGKQASVPDTWLDLQWIPNRLGLGGIGDDANPMEAIYEMHVNAEWGLNRSPDLLDTESMIAVGRRLKEEGIGITVPITAKTEVRQLIDDICEHLDMVRYTDPETGKLTFKLIRDDYDPAQLSTFDETMCSSVEFTRTVWSNTNGAVCVSYTDSAALYETSTVTVNDPANIQINEGHNNVQDLAFSYFTTAGNARWAAQRELKQQGFPLAAATLICNRKGAFVRPGDVIKLNWPPYGIKDLILRVTDVDLGDFIGGEVTVTCLEDVFGMGKSKFSPNDSTEWKPPQNYPTGVQLFRYFEAPWELMQVDDSYVFALAAQPDLKTQKWTVHRYRDYTWQTTNSLTKWTPAGQLVGDYLETGDMEDVTGFEVFDLGGIQDLAARSLSTGVPGFTAARNGARLLMVDNEIMGWGNLTQLANGRWRVQNIIRATYDTVPASHTAGAPVYFIDAGFYTNVTTGGAVIPTGHVTSESYNITTATAEAEEEFDQTKVSALSTVRRPERPTPPGRIRLTTHRKEQQAHIDQAAGNLGLSWALRNKWQSFGCVSQNDVSDFFSGLNINPPEGLQTVIRVYVGSELIRETVLAASVEETITDEDGEETAVTNLITAWEYTWAERCLDKPAFDVETRLEITARLNGLESYQLHQRTFSWKPSHVLDAAETEEAALNVIGAAWRDGSVVVVMPDEANNKQIPVKDAPLIILGTIYTEEQPGAVLCRSGWVVPSGKVLAVTGADSFAVLDLANGFVLLSYYVPEEQGGISAWQYNGTGFERIAVPE